MSYGPRCTVAAMFCFALLATTAAWSVNPAESTPSRDVDQSIQSLRTVGGPGLEVDQSRLTGLVRFMSGAKSRGIPLTGAGGPDVRALEFVDLYGPAFGLDSDSVVVERVSRSDDTGIDHVRLQQVVKGIPVAGGETIVHLRGNEVVSVLAKTAPDLDRVATTPVIAASAAIEAARCCSRQTPRNPRCRHQRAASRDFQPVAGRRRWLHTVAASLVCRGEDIRSPRVHLGGRRNRGSAAQLQPAAHWPQSTRL